MARHLPCLPALACRCLCVPPEPVPAVAGAGGSHTLSPIAQMAAQAREFGFVAGRDGQAEGEIHHSHFNGSVSLPDSVVIWSDLPLWNLIHRKSDAKRALPASSAGRRGAMRSPPRDRIPGRDKGRGKPCNLRQEPGEWKPLQPIRWQSCWTCPPATGNLLNGAAHCIDFEAGRCVFRQSAVCQGLYVVVSGQFLRKTERLETRLTLGRPAPAIWWNWPPRWAMATTPTR